MQIQYSCSKLTKFLLVILSGYIFTACSHTKIQHSTQQARIDQKPDYSNLDYWAAHPWKWDPSDSIPKPLRTTETRDTLADVFFIHPTTFTAETDSNWNASLSDAFLKSKTENSTILYQASAFNQHARVFAPFYRQAHLRCFFTPEKFKAAIAFEKAYSDIKKAFQYYLDHYNFGRPIIIASHSQGTIHAARILKDFFDGKKLQEQLICAYVIGMPTPEHYFKSISSCSDSSATGCFVGWRTYKRGYIDTEYIAKENFKSVVTNPLSWTSDTLFHPSSENMGGVLKNFNKINKGVVNTNIHGNVLWSSKPRFFGNIFLTKKNYHIADINLFYMNIRQNVTVRLRSYIKAKNN